MLFKFLFCCSNSTLKENKTITFEEKDNNIVNGTIPPYVNMNKHREKNKKDEIAHKEIKKESKNKDRSLNHKKNNFNTVLNSNVNFVNNINSYYARERSNKIKNSSQYINTISNKSSFKSLLVRNCNNINMRNNIINNINTRFKNNNNAINNFQTNNNFQKTHSVLSFSNLIVKNNTKTNNNDDTEILSPYELLLSGEIFFNKEIKIDRLGIKPNTVGDKKIRKEHLIKFGIVFKNKSQKESDYNTSDYKMKDEKEEKCSQNLKVDINSLSSSFQIKGKECNLDMVLNIDNNKEKKLFEHYEQIIASENKEDEDFSPTIKRDNRYLTLFTIRYIASMEMFEFCSTHNKVPVELLLDHEYQLRNGYDYNILLGEICVILKVFKNINDEDILKIRIKDKIEDIYNFLNISINKKEEEFYIFNSSNYINKLITIGRRNCTVNINNDTVSDMHLKILYSDNTDTFSVKDNNSQNGSYLLLNEPFNFLYIKKILSFRLFDSKFNIKFIHNSE
jgi:hypothetical protein